MDFDDALRAVKALDGRFVTVVITGGQPLGDGWPERAARMQALVDESADQAARAATEGTLKPEDLDTIASTQRITDALSRNVHGSTQRMHGRQRISAEEPGRTTFELHTDEGTRGEYDLDDLDYDNAHWTTDNRTLVVNTRHSGRIEITPDPR